MWGLLLWNIPQLFWETKASNKKIGETQGSKIDGLLYNQSTWNNHERI